MPTASVRVLVVEDHEPYREFVLSALQARPEFQVISQVADGAEAVQSAEELQPDLILLDIGLPGLNGFEAARRILHQCPASKILFLTQEKSDEFVFEAFKIGASGYIVKTDAASDLLPGLDSVVSGKRFMSRSIAKS